MESMMMEDERIVGFGPDCLIVETDSQGRMSSREATPIGVLVGWKEESNEVAGEEGG